MNRRAWLAVAAVAVIAVSACTPSETVSPSASEGASSSASPGASPNGSPGTAGGPTTVRVQLPGPIDGQFAGYVAAQQLGYFSDDNLVVTFVPGDAANLSTSYFSPGVSGPEFTVAPAVPVLAAREHGSDLVNIAQVFQKSGTVVLTWKKDGITDICGLKGKRVGLWSSGGGAVPNLHPLDDLEVTSSLAACPLTSTDYHGVEILRDVTGFLDHSLDATQAATYDQVAQVLEATNPTTSQQYTTDDLTLLSPTDRHATLQDGIYASAAWLAGSGHRDVAVAFIRASIRGWLYCRDHLEDCVQFTTKAGTNLGESHTRWMINEVNGLIWPSPGGVGQLDPVLWQQTITVATAGGALTKAPSLNAYDDSLVPDATAILQGKDLTATDYQKGTVVVAPGGK
ncbi:MAG TPA: ABC transporter substrate-binding protein [Candidatus Limnocylindrales bacterium]